MSLAPLQVLGGEAALTITEEFPWPKAWLWSILLLAVLAVAAMAVRLYKEISVS